MADKPFVINDRRKFTAEGDLRDDTQPASPAESKIASPGAQPASPGAEPTPAGSVPDSIKPHKEPIAFPASSSRVPAAEPGRSEDEPDPRAGHAAESTAAGRTHETLAFPSGARSGTVEQEPDDANPSMPPLTAEQSEQAARAYAATVERLDTALRANNLGSEPLPEMNFERLVQSLYMQALLQLGGAAEPGQAPQVDLLGSRQTIDMLTVIAARTEGNLSANEQVLVQSALFELRMGFLEMTQALARQAASRQPGGTFPGAPKGPGAR